ncbi:MAG TPA: Crp/Fnr family transcriptional regulator [Rhizomicrobium sp.]|nr:Crp/Fnr family transcriptional regulator [Rhizomicrobium sp.]
MVDHGDDILEEAFGRGPERELAHGESLFRQGDRAAAIFLIVRGRLRMIRRLATGAQVTIHTGRAGEMFAEGALFSEAYQCDAIAAEATQVRMCAKAELLAAAKRSPTTMLAILERVARQLHHARTMRELRNILSAEERALEHLRLSLPRGGAGDVVVFDRPLMEIADDLGLAHEAYYRALAALASQGRIERKGRTIILLAEAGKR